MASDSKEDIDEVYCTSLSGKTQQNQIGEPKAWVKHLLPVIQSIHLV